MENSKGLNTFQIIVLIVMIVMTVVFVVIYPITISKVGFEYNNTILVQSKVDGIKTFSGKIRGKQAQFTVSEDNTVVFRHGDKTYGPYTAKEDPSAVPTGSNIPYGVTGVELRKGEDILFRGGVYYAGDYCFLYNEDGTSENIVITYSTSDGIERDADGNIIDPMEPTAATILKLMNKPRLTHKGSWIGFFGGVFICLINTLHLLLADELFRMRLSFQIQDADRVEPTELEIAGRYVAWSVMPFVALTLYIIGLQ